MDPWLVPSPLAHMLTHRVVIGDFAIEPAQLSHSAVIEQLPRKVRREAAKVVIDRIVGSGKHMATLRKRPIGFDIKVPDDFEARELSRASRAVFNRVLNWSGFRALDDWTWGQLLDNRQTGVKRLPLITAMAEIEWRILHRTVNVEQASRESDTVQLDDLLSDERIDQVLDNDLRFAWRRFGTQARLSELLREWKASGHALNPVQRKLVQTLHHAFRMTLGDDIQDIGRALAEAAFARVGARSRSTEVFAARYGARIYGPQLEAVGKRHACSASRVTQLGSVLLKASTSRSIASPAALEMLKKVHSLAFMQAAQIEEAAGLVPGNGHSLRTFRRFCLTVLRPTLAFDISTESSLGEKWQGISADRESASTFKAALQYAKRESRIAGAANITSVAGALALDTAKPVSREHLESMIDRLPQAIWLDREHGWFAVNDRADSLIYSRVLKMLAVAKKGLSIREIGESLWRDAKLADESGGELALAPMPILKKAILSWTDGIKEDARGFLVHRSGIQASSVLSSLELKLFNALAKCGGVATVMSLLSRIGGKPDSLRTTLSYAVFAYPVGNGLYALRGWPVSERDILAALADKVSERGEDTEERKRPTVMVIRPH